MKSPSSLIIRLTRFAIALGLVIFVGWLLRQLDWQLILAVIEPWQTMMAALVAIVAAAIAYRASLMQIRADDRQRKDERRQHRLRVATALLGEITSIKVTLAALRKTIEQFDAHGTGHRSPRTTGLGGRMLIY